MPVCLSATYIAYASARMEPVFCVLGESAGVAAAQAVRQGVPVQAIDSAALRSRLLERGEVLAWTEELDKRAAKGNIEAGEWASLAAWSEDKPGWEWLFPFIDGDKEGKITAAEHGAFQKYKSTHPDWKKQVQVELDKK